MEKTKIKICGLKRPCDIEFANALLPDYIGFVFAKKKRLVTREQAQELKQLLDPRIKAVGVFIDKPKEDVLSLLEDDILDVAQLHGSESEEYIIWLKERTGKPVVKVTIVSDTTDFKKVFSTNADMVLLDSGAGDGKVFDWQRIRDLSKQYDKPFFLAGGLDSSNVQNAIETTHPYAVDVSSGVETDDLKDFEKMKCFVSAVRNIGKEENK